MSLAFHLAIWYLTNICLNIEYYVKFILNCTKTEKNKTLSSNNVLAS